MVRVVSRSSQNAGSLGKLDNLSVSPCLGKWELWGGIQVTKDKCHWPRKIKKQNKCIQLLIWPFLPLEVGLRSYLGSLAWLTLRKDPVWFLSSTYHFPLTPSQYSQQMSLLLISTSPTHLQKTNTKNKIKTNNLHKGWEHACFCSGLYSQRLAHLAQNRTAECKRLLLNYWIFEWITLYTSVKFP